MPVVATDIRLFGSAVKPEDDTTLNVGGAIVFGTGGAACVKPVFTDISPSGLVEMVSSAAGDTTQTVTLTGLNSVNSEVVEVKTLNGTTAVDFTTNWKVIWKAVKSAATAGTVTVRKDGAAGDLMIFDRITTGTPFEVMTIRRVFYKMNSETGTEINMEKVFAKNTNGTDTLSSVTVAQLSDATGLITTALAASINDTGTNGGGNTRTTDGTGLTFDDTTDNVPGVGSNLASGDTIGIWLKASLGAAQAATISTYGVRAQGNSA